MTHLLRCLITVIAVCGLAYPSVAPRQGRSRSLGFSRGQRVRSTSQAVRSHSPAIRDAANLKLLALGDSGEDDTAAALTNERIRWPSLTAYSVPVTTPELLPFQQYESSAFGRAPPL
jgi:hypothetical protein